MEKRTSSEKPVIVPQSPPPPPISGVHTSTYGGAAKMGIFYSVKAKLLVFGLSISLIPIVIITTLSYLNGRNALQRQIMQDLTAVAEFKKAHVLEFLEAKKGRTIDFSSDGFIRDSLEYINSGIVFLRQDNITDLNIHLSMNKMPLDPHIAAIEVVDMDGKTVASTNETMIGRDVSGLEIYKRARHAYYNNPCVGQPYHSTYLDAKIIDVSAPITSRRSSNTIGVLISHYYASFLNKITTQRAGLGETGEVYIVNKDKRMITESRFIEKAPLEVAVDTEPVRMAVERGENMVGIYPDYRNIPVVGASSYIPGYGWTFLAEIDKAEAFAPLKWLGIFAGIVGGICAAVVSGGGIIFLKMALRPIVRLTDAARRFAEGDLKARAETTYRDEIGDLAESFNTMVGKLGKEITMREKILALLKESEGSYRTLIGTARDAIISIGEDRIINIWNKSAERIFGYSKSEIIGRAVTTIIPERYRERHENGMRRFLETGETVIMNKTVEVHGITKEGIDVPIEMSLAFQKGKDGRRSFTAIIRDITERKTKEEEVRKLSYAVEQSPVSVIITDTSGNIEYVNKKFIQTTGYSYEEIIGQNLRALKSGDKPSEEYRELWEAITSGKEWRGEFCNKKKSGELYWESASISPVKSGAGVITHFIAVKEDITEQKQMEGKLRMSYKMASLGRLTAGVFHEILNPINIISAHVQLLLMDAEKGLKAEEDLKSIQEEIRRIVKITDSLLRFSRKGKLEVGKIIINDLLENVISIVEPDMKLDNINFIRDLDDNALAITANSDELRQVFLNLIHNAKDAMPDGGAITVRTRMICRIEPGIRSTESGAERKELEGQIADPALLPKSAWQSSKPKGDIVRISFEDTGSGISKEDIASIFDPFFTTKEEGKGTGLGLSTAYGIIENHGGEISVKSEAGKGTTFTIDLPVGD